MQHRRQGQRQIAEVPVHQEWDHQALSSILSFDVYRVDDSFEFISDRKMTTSYDVTITDPPYTDTVQFNLCSGSLVGTRNVPKYNLDFDPLSNSQAKQWIDGALRITERWVISFCAVEAFGRYQDMFGKQYVRGGIWLKGNAMGQLTADRPATCYEGIACLHRLDVKKRWNGRGSYGAWSCNGTRGKKGRHPNEKPVDLCLKLVALFSERGETVFDPFCGSGAIGEACIRLGRNYVGLDQKQEWVDKTIARLGAELEPVTDEHALSLCRVWGK